MIGPENPTLVERIVHLIPLRYPVSALIWSVVLGSPVFHVFEYIDHGSTTFALTAPQLTADVLFTLVPFYALLVVRYLRLRILKAEPQIVPIMSGGESTYHSAFGRISRNPPVLIISLLLTIIIFPAITSKLSLSLIAIWTFISTFVSTLAVITIAWSYCISSWGLHSLGSSNLKLKSFLEDRTMGARAIGNVALSLTVAYLGGILLVFLLFSSQFLTNLSFQAIISTFMALGVIMFFLPLNSLHKKMQAEKHEQQKTLAQQYLTLKNNTQTVSPDAPVAKILSELLKMKDLEISERKLANTPTWPFDVQLLVKMITIVISVTAAVLARIIINFLRL